VRGEETLGRSVLFASIGVGVRKELRKLKKLKERLAQIMKETVEGTITPAESRRQCREIEKECASLARLMHGPHHLKVR
jgi:hypothetical protein